MAKEIVLAGACRTALGKFGGTLTNTPAVELGAIVIKEAIRRAGIKPEDVDEVLMGNVLQAGLGQSPARQAAVKAGIPVEVPALTINNVCGSGLKVVNMAAAMIEAGEADVMVVGGMENMSAAPYAMPQARFGYRMNDGKLVDVMIKDGLWDAFNDYHMGITAENVAEKYGITREMQDEFSAWSQQKCEAAQKAGKFDEEIVPVPVKVKKEVVEFKVDEFPRQGVTAEGLAKLKPAFKKDGTVTAVAAGTATISASAEGADPVTCTVTVKEAPKKDLVLRSIYNSKGVAQTEFSMSVGDPVVPMTVDGTDSTVKWSTEHSSIATINSDGEVTAVSSGRTTIIAEVDGQTLKCEVRVN